jgi:RNA polymerase sigma-70 factor (ECF subfamily)
MYTESSPPSDLQPTDEEVIARVLAGETAIFEVLMRRYNQRLFRAARAVVRDDAEAEDVLQEAYVNAYTHLASFEGRAKISTWLTRIVIHEASARLRKQRRFTSDEGIEEREHQSDDPEDQAGSRELALQVEAAIDRLPEAFRTVLMLRAVEGLSGVETAACLGVPEQTVKTRLFRAREMVHKDLAQRAESTLVSVHRFLAERCDRVVAAVLSRIAGGAIRPLD